MKLVSVSYEQSRLNFFRDQLAAANRRLDWSMKHNPDCYDQAEKGEVVSFYEWAVRMAEKEVDDHSICGATNLPCIKCNPGGCNNRKGGVDSVP